MINNKEYSRLSAYKIAEMVKAKDISAIEVAEAAISRMDATEPFIHAFCTPTRDLAREMAKKIDSQISNGEKVGDLAGVPIGIKDLICTKGIKTTSGSNIYKDYIPKCDDIIIERLREAGAVILGKTNVPEFGYSGVGHNPVFPTTRNPWNLDLTSGGSSAGAGASVAAGVTPFSIGSDGGGSIRIPAAHCGLFGIKASFGRVPLWPGTRDHTMPGMSSWEGLEHIGPISRTVKDSAIILSVISGPDMRDQHSLPAANFNWLNCLEGGIRGLRVAYSEDWGYAAVDPKVRKIVRNAVKVFETDLGCEVVEANPGWDDPYEAFWAIVAMETDLSGLRELVSKHAHEMTPHLVDFILKPWTAEDFTDAVIARKAVNNKMSEFMK